MKMADVVPVHIILMGNTMKTLPGKNTLKHVFDLKGSLINREVKIRPGKQHKPSTTLKDVNVLNMVKKGDKVRRWKEEMYLFSYNIVLEILR